LRSFSFPDNGEALLAITISIVSYSQADGDSSIAQAAYYGEREGAGNDFESETEPEHAVEIITLRSPAWMQDRVSKS
jgi:hypothetical protein